MPTALDQLRLAAIARSAIRAWLSGEPSAPPESDALPAPVFVTLRNPDGTLRGCIGSVSPVEPSVVHETARSAVLAASRDPRFSPVRAEELPGLSIEVSVLLPPEEVSRTDQLDPERYGVIVRDAAGRQGLLLPGVTGISDVDTQLDVARRKAGIPPDSPVELRRFEVVKFEE